MKIRPETENDIAAIHAVNIAAFEADAEANLVDLLREQADPFISLVAEREGEIVGHIAFSPVNHSDQAELSLLGLGPMAVLPGLQNQGIGSKLVLEGLERCRKIEAGAIVVLGHPEYYPRFGFVPASQFGIRSEYDVPDEVFMAMELDKGYLADAVGLVKYHPAFSES
ncbi:MAG: N-acetyltransferase [Acidobacteria bacterium]|nr:MAG: N-acetyltransferase [Acidobacteriota bacterium]REK04092.1 MAG: N-acetyltransferase [Acidobacteriota bacterium]REK15254.1 MAG: N-acetyltransferase [Acidobacteriota bacterium]REK46344.1 MAG: N-acetyltransferase [Acidobacteriota bacterium]